MAKKCSLCKNELPEYATSEWAYRLGNSMYFCSYGCMQAKKSGIQQKQAETFAKRKAEKEARAKAAEEAAKERRPQAEWTVVGKIDKEEKINEAAREQLTEDPHIKPLAKDIGHEELQPVVIEDEMHNYPDAMAQAMLDDVRRRQPLIKDVHVQVQDDGLLVTGTPTEEMMQMIEEDQPMEAAETTMEHFDPDMYAATEDVGKTDPQEKEGYRNFLLVGEMQTRIDQLELRNRQLCEERDAWKDGYNKLDKRCDSLLSTIDTLMAIIKEH